MNELAHYFESLRNTSRSTFLILICAFFVITPKAHANLKSRVLSVVKAVSIRKEPLSEEALQRLCQTKQPLCRTYAQKYDDRFFDIQGDCYRKASTWFDVLKNEFDEDTQIGEGDRTRNVKLAGEELGGYDFFHAFNLVYGPAFTARIDPIIVDATYLQFFNHGGVPNELEPVFVGTQRDLVELVKKHHNHVKLNRMTTSLTEGDADNFVRTMWPVWTHL